MSQPYLRFLDIYCGAYCNLACNHCDARSHVLQTKNYDPTLDDILTGIKLVKEKFDIIYYGTSGGEPLLYLDRITEIFKFIKSIDPDAVLLLPTNGTLIDKKLNELVALIKQFDVSVFVCDHFSGFEDKTLSNKVKQNFKLLADAVNLPSGNVSEFYKNLFDIENKKNDILYQEWLDKRQNFYDYIEDTEQVFYNKTFVHYREQSTFKQNYQLIDNIPKPFKTNNPAKSYQNGCTSDMCSFLIDKKLYKCSSLGTLNRFLNHHNLLNDPDWQKYLNYKPINLENYNNDEIDFFDKTKYCEIGECDMCSNKDTSFLKTPEYVLKKYTN